MDISEVEQRLLSEDYSLFNCREENGYLLVSTPFHYTDGSILGVYCRVEGDSIVVTDGNDTYAWLSTAKGMWALTPKQSKLIEEICRFHKVEFDDLDIVARCGPDDSLTEVILRVVQAIIRVADISYTFNFRGYESPADDVADYLCEQGLSVVRAEKHVGCSDEKWDVDFTVSSNGLTSLVGLLTSHNEDVASREIDRLTAAWNDLSPLPETNGERQLVTLFDDISRLWNEEHFKQFEAISKVAFWSRPDKLVQILTDGEADGC